MPGLWDGNPVKSDCYDHYITTDVINSFDVVSCSAINEQYVYTKALSALTSSAEIIFRLLPLRTDKELHT